MLPLVQASFLSAAYLETALRKGLISETTHHEELAHIYLRLALGQSHQHNRGD